MLDEANVGRFRDLLVELSARTQFVLVTHNRNTVQAANVIYGITMGRDSSSQVISLRLDEMDSDAGRREIWLSARTQFVLVTHKKRPIIYGITMGRDSSSQIIAPG
jgi:chromosome segregation ATPase